MLLAIDTSSGTAVAVVDHSGGILAERSVADTRRHAEVVGILIGEVLAAAAVQPHVLSAVAAGMGPGPYTGLRVGIAAAQAFAYGIGQPFVPVSSHDGLAWGWYQANGSEHRLQIVTDARRRELAVSEYIGLDPAGLPIRASGPKLYPVSEAPAAVAEQFDVRGSVDRSKVSAGAIGMLAELGYAAGRLPIAEQEPIYLREPDVTLSPGVHTLLRSS